jgi:hypothetical protein
MIRPISPRTRWKDSRKSSARAVIESATVDMEKRVDRGTIVERSGDVPAEIRPTHPEYSVIREGSPPRRVRSFRGGRVFAVNSKRSAAGRTELASVSRSDQEGGLPSQFEATDGRFNEETRFFVAFRSGDLTQQKHLNICKVRLMLREVNPAVRNSSDTAF